jgi:Domain of unknown function (DUF4168)
MNIRPSLLALAAALVGALTLGGALPVQAQDSKPQQKPPATQQLELSQRQLESFAAAVLQVHEIRSKWQPLMQGADSAEKAKELQTQATAEMISAVEAKGLTVETYNAIATAARDNPDLASRITKLIDQTR